MAQAWASHLYGLASERDPMNWVGRGLREPIIKASQEP